MVKTVCLYLNIYIWTNAKRGVFVYGKIRTEASARSQKLLNPFIFVIVLHFSSAFGFQCAHGGCLMELCIQLSITMLGKQLIQNNLFEIGVP